MFFCISLSISVNYRSFIVINYCFGLIYTFYILFFRLIVILNDKEALTEAYVKQSDIFSDRFEFWTETNVANYDLKGLFRCIEPM